MPTITFDIDAAGESHLTIKGIKGVACKPIHDAISADLANILGIPEMVAEDTPEAREKPPVYTTVATARARR